MSSLDEMVEAVKAEREYLSDLAWNALIDDAPDAWPLEWDPILDGARWTTVEPPPVEEQKSESLAFTPSPEEAEWAAIEFDSDDDCEVEAEVEVDMSASAMGPMW